jgi:CheY-like chemotaxis protein
MASSKILIVDDSRLSRRRFLAQPLRDAGYEVVEAADGQEGLAMYNEHQPDVIVSDLLMPVMDGFEFLAALNEQGSTCPAIVASADIQETTRSKVEELGAFGFLNKPYKSDELLAVVDQAIQSSLTVN